MEQESKVIKEQSYQALYEELEKKHGPITAQHILDLVKKAENQNSVQSREECSIISKEYEDVIYKIRSAINRLKVIKHEKEHWPDNVESLQEESLKEELRRLQMVYKGIAPSYYNALEQSTLSSFRSCFGFEVPDVSGKRILQREPETMNKAA